MVMNTEILIIEDDPVIRKELQTILEGNKYHTSVIEDFSDVTEQVRKINPHLILLDITLPQENGFTICSGIRSFSQAPIIFVTSCNTDMDELNSIMLGGDAFITKPYHTAILLAKIASLLKRAYPDSQSRHLTYQGVSLSLETGTIEAEGKQTELTKNELKIMYYLFEHAGTICTRADLIEYLWDNQLYVDDNALSVNIGRIREKLSKIGVKDFIKTNCIAKNSKIVLQLMNGKIITLISSNEESCSALSYDSNENNNIRILTGYFYFTKNNYEELKNSPVTLMRIHFAGETKDYVLKSELNSETLKTTSKPDSYFMEFLKCVE